MSQVQLLISGGMTLNLLAFLVPPLELQDHGEVTKALWVFFVLSAWPLGEWPTKDLENCPGALALNLSSLPLGLREEEDFLESTVYLKNLSIVLITLGFYKGKYILIDL